MTARNKRPGGHRGSAEAADDGHAVVADVLIPLLPLIAQRIRLTCLRDTTIGLFPEAQLSSLLLSTQPEHKNHQDSVSIEVPRSMRGRVRVGDRFEFALFASVLDSARLAVVEELLRALPGSAPKFPHPVAFADNWRLQSMHPLDSAGMIDSAFIAAEAALWAPIPRFRIRLTSPLRILSGRKGVRGRSRFCGSAKDVDDRVFNEALANSLVSLKREFHLLDWKFPDYNLRIVRNELYFVDPSQRQTSKGAKPLDEGLIGEVVVEWLTPPSTAQWQHLVLLQYLGLGQSRRLGLGRMRLELMSGEHSKLMPCDCEGSRK
jgi:hypothetical protein